MPARASTYVEGTLAEARSAPADLDCCLPQTEPSDEEYYQQYRHDGADDSNHRGVHALLQLDVTKFCFCKNSKRIIINTQRLPLYFLCYLSQACCQKVDDSNHRGFHASSNTTVKSRKDVEMMSSGETRMLQ